MKFKLVLILFNVLIVVSFLLLFLVPVLILGWDFAGTIWSDAWYLPPIFFLLLLVLNGYFFLNRRYFLLMEQERWTDVLDFLDDEFYRHSRGRRGFRLNSQRIRVYINASLVSSQSSRLGKLETFLREKQPSLFEEFFLPLGLPRLLKDDPRSMEQYFREVSTLKNPADRGWCLWLLAFSLLLQKRVEEVTAVLSDLVKEKDPLLRLLVLYLFSITGEMQTSGDADLYGKEREKLREELTPRRFRELKEKNRENLLFFALRDFIDQAFAWLYPPAAGGSGSAGNE